MRCHFAPSWDGDDNNSSNHRGDNEEEESGREEEEEENQKIARVSHDLEEPDPWYAAGGTTKWRGLSERSRSLSRS